MKNRMSCTSPDCPEISGGRCWGEWSHHKREIVRELRVIRKLYDDFELDGVFKDDVSWKGWKLVRNVISDRIEELTGTRV